MSLKKLSIVIPAKNEEKRIARTLSNYGSYFQSHKKKVEPEIIVVVNDTWDKTSKIVDKYAKTYPFIKRVETAYASGKGGAVALGFKEATGDFVGYVDADGAVPASEIFNLYEFIHETPWLDGVVGTRSKKTQMTFKRKILSTIFNVWVKLLFNLRYKDTQCAAKIFRKKVAKDIAKKLSNTGWVFDVNLLLVAMYLNYRILEHPVLWSEREGSKFSIYTGLVKVPVELFLLKRLELAHNSKEFLARIWDDIVEIWKPKKARNILIFAWRDIKHPEMGGSEIYVHQIAKRLVKKHNVTLFTSRPANLHRTDIIDGVKIVRKGNFVTVYLWAAVYYFRYLGKRADFVIDVQNGIPFFTPLYSREPKLMLLHHVHKEQWFKQFPLFVAFMGYIFETVIMPLVYRKLPVITVSPSSKAELNKLTFPDKRIYIAYNSIPPKVGGTYQKSKSPLLLYIGRVKAYKRLEVAIEAVSELKDTFPDIKLAIGGCGRSYSRTQVTC